MTREEQIAIAAVEAQNIFDSGSWDTGLEKLEMHYARGFLSGAAWADVNPIKLEEILAFVGIAYRALKSIEKLSGVKFRELSPEEKAK